MASHPDVCDRWVDIVLGRTTNKVLTGSRIYARGDIIYSYGNHFPMAHAIRDKKRNVVLFLVNGDRFSVSTSRHQSYLRSALRKADDVPQVIIPYSALRAANVDPDSVELIEATADRNVVTTHESWMQPDGSEWRDVHHREYVLKSDEELQAICAARDEKNMEDWERKHRYAMAELASETPPKNSWDHYWSQDWLPKASVREYPRETTVDDLGHYEFHKHVIVSTERKLFRSRSKYADTIQVTDMGDGRTHYQWETRRHWLGESLIRAKLRWRGYTVCKPCRGRGQLPDAPPRPPWQRREDGKTPFELWEEQWQCKDCNGHGGRHWTRARTTYFLSGFDMNEPRALYFFCELPPKVRPKSVAEAYEMLKPETVKLAEQMGRNVRRQGDIFAIPIPTITKRELRKQGARFEPRGQLLGTNHVATETAYLPDGTTMVRGTLVHAPEWRRPDHIRVKLDKSWHVVLKNTVPISA